MQKCDVSVVLEAFLDHSFDDVLTWLSTEVPEVTAIEVGAGGYAPHPHLDPDALLTDASARQVWLGKLADHGIKLDALNVWGNPLHPDKAIADDHDAALCRAVRLAGELGTNTVVAMSGAPAAVAGDHAAVFGAGGWLPYLEGVHDRQWEECVVPYWSELSEFAAKETPLSTSASSCTRARPSTTWRPSKSSSAWARICTPTWIRAISSGCRWTPTASSSESCRVSATFTPRM